MYQLTTYQELLCKEIVDAAYSVHSKLGTGLLEKLYEICFCYELKKRGLLYKRQTCLPIQYDELLFKESLRIDVLVGEEIICELKAVDIINPLWQAQILSYLKLSGLHVGFLINFNVLNIGKGIRRYSI